ncbi:hypothetical protein Pth03_41680 [Planotetraspora thailandica]|uniref:Uncharacterized protein n=1 Tax=Planotetraspora thailandica TaxID=487172 RepID=A0A8J3V149_9ACTN|nr:hypothetical protein [Planotetraspora thailandica]GII55779.1 hypothetical protein Pth03_41680 [Planotetraspora thailandica]
MMQSLVRVLVPGPARRAVRARIDARYATKADLRQEIRALRQEIERLRTLVTATANGAKAADDAANARRLAEETAEALDHVLQNEVRLRQAVDGLAARLPATDTARTDSAR